MKTDIQSFVLDKLNNRIKAMPQLAPEISCSSFYYPKIFGTDVNPELVAQTIKEMIKTGKIIQCEDAHGHPSFVPEEFVK